MSNPNRKYRTLTQAVEEAESHICQRCDAPKARNPLTLEDAQREVCRCKDYCGYQFCAADGPARPEYGYHPATEDGYDREADYWHWSGR